MLHHRLIFISFLLILWSAPAILHAQSKFTGGTVTVKPGGDFTSLSDAARHYNDNGISANTTLEIASDLTEIQTVLFTNTHGSNTFKLTITTDDTRRTVSGDIDGPVIHLFGANNITIDGITSATTDNPTANKLVIRNTYAVESTSVGTIRVEADGEGTGMNIVIRNTEMSNAVWGEQSIANLLAAVDAIQVEGCYLHGANENLIAQGLKNLIFTKNVVRNAANSGLSIGLVNQAACSITQNDIGGISASGTGDTKLQGIFLTTAGVAGVLDISNNTIANIENIATGQAGARGMLLSVNATRLDVKRNIIRNISNDTGTLGQNAAGISCLLYGNTVANVEGNTVEGITDRNDPVGLELGAATGTASALVSYNTVSNVTASATVTGNNARGILMNATGSVASNKILNIHAAVGAAAGLYGRNTFGSETSFINNMVYDIQGKIAIGIHTEMGANFKAYHNTVFLSAKNNDDDETIGFRTSATVVFRNNLLVNMAAGNTAANRAVVIRTGSPGTFSGNRYFVSQGYIGQTADNALYRNINAWNTATGDFSILLPAQPAFVSATDLHLNGTSKNDPLLHVPLISGVTVDFDGHMRNNACINAAGADNFTSAPVFIVGQPVQPDDCLAVINFEATGGAFPFTCVVNGANYSVVVDSVLVSGNYALHAVTTSLATGNHTITLKDAGSCSSTNATSFAYKANKGVWYVNGGIASSGDGTSPATAFQTLQEALAVNCLRAGDTIKVATGIYYPSVQLQGTGSGLRDRTFFIEKAIHIFGGYKEDFTKRDTAAYRTTLSGDLNMNNTADNSDAHHVIVWNVTVAGSGTIDGFTITGGNANLNSVLSGIQRYNGGGLNLAAGTLTVKNNIFKGNNAIITNGSGAAIYSNGTLTAIKNIFYNNRATTNGGALYIAGTTMITENRFDSNTAATGGAVYLNGILTATGNYFTNNSATNGGAVGFNSVDGVSGIFMLNTFAGNNATTGSGGAVWASSSVSTNTSSFLFKFNTFTGNTTGTGGSGGAIYVRYTGGFRLYNNTILGNSTQRNAANAGGGVYVDQYGRLTFGGNVVTGNTSAQSVYDISTTTNNNAVDDGYNLLTSAIGATALPGGISANNAYIDVSALPLLFPGSLGNNIFTPVLSPVSGHLAPVAKPLVNITSSLIFPRIPFANLTAWGVPNGSNYIDQAYKVIPNKPFNSGSVYFDAQACASTTTWYVNANASVNGNGATATTPCKDLSTILMSPCLKTNDVIKVAGGTYKPAIMMPGGANARDNSFLVTKSVRLEGGYNSAFTVRDTAAYRTILSGDIGVQGSNSDNCHHVVVWNTDDNGTGTFDGFIVQDGNANVNSTFAITSFLPTVVNVTRNVGGGFHLNNGKVNISNSIFKNNLATSNGGALYALVPLNLQGKMIFKNNTATGAGGAIYANSSLTLQGNMVFENNTANGQGGAIWKSAVAGTFFDAGQLVTLTVTGNTSKNLGGGIWTGVSLDLSKLQSAIISNNTATQHGGGIYTNTNVALALKNATFSGNRAGFNGTDFTGSYSGGAIYANSELTLQGKKCVFENNTANYQGGAIWKTYTNPKTNINASLLDTLIVTGNTARTDNGGGIYINIYSTTNTNKLYAVIADFSNLKYGKFSNNTAGKHGGAIYAGNISEQNRLLLRNTVFSGNKAGWDFTANDYSATAYDGGGIYSNMTLALIGKSVFENNTASGSGGGIFKSGISVAYDNSGSLDASSLDTLVITGNVARTGTGGGISSLAPLSFVDLKKGTISNNTAKTSGGGIYADNGLAVILATFENNETTGSNGGALYIKGSLDISSSNLLGNKAPNGAGGAIYKDNTGNMAISKSTFSGNRAKTGGAVRTDAILGQNIWNTTFSGNSAETSGGALYVANGANTNIRYTTFNHNNTTDNQANAVFYNAPGGNLNGNIIYGNGTGTGTEINNAAGTTATYNIVRQSAVPGFVAGTTNQEVAAGRGIDIFAYAVGDDAILANNGGPTKTLLIQQDGLAYNQIPVTEAGNFGVGDDQRGENRMGLVADIGSIELNPAPCNLTNIWYVDVATATPGDGTSPANPANSLATVLAHSCLKDGDIIKVAEGNYFTTNAERNQSFIITKAVTLQGGYTFTFSESDRNVSGHPTILDGRNTSYHVILMNVRSTKTVAIDGFTIQNGRADDTGVFFVEQDNGGGIYVNNGTLKLSNSIIRNNTAANKGGGIYVSVDATLVLENTSSSGNKAGYAGTSFNRTVPEVNITPTAAQLELRSGGGVAALGQLELRGVVKFANDQAGLNGGAIFKGYRNTFVANILDSLTIENCSAWAGGVPVNSKNGYNYYGGGGIFTIVDLDLSKVKKSVFRNCRAESCEGGGILITNRSGRMVDLVVANAEFIACWAADDGGGIEVYGATNARVTVKDVLLKDCYAGRYGGALGMGYALTLQGKVVMDNNTAGSNGGGISQWIVNDFNVAGLDTLIVTNNKSLGTGTTSIGGGGIWVDQANLDFSNVKYAFFENNYSKAHGGAIKMENSSYTLKLENAKFSDNKAGYTGTAFSGAGSGGGVYSAGPVNLSEDVSFKNNTANTSGGAIFANSTLVAKDTLVITGNTARTNNGGGIYANSTADLSGLLYGNISSNKTMAANTQGGGIYAGNSLSLSRTTLHNNTAIGDGGGIYHKLPTNAKTGTLTVAQSTFSENNAGKGGGIYTVNTFENGNTIVNSTFSRNTAMGDGGAIHSSGTSTDVTVLRIAFSTFNGNTAANDAGHAIYSQEASPDIFNGNILYGNGASGSEMNKTNITTGSYNILPGDILPQGTDNFIIPAGEAANIFADILSGETAELKDNGGPAMTLNIKETGLAHNFIPVEKVNLWKPVFGALATDQCDNPRINGCNADIGAVELKVSDDLAPFTLANGRTICYGNMFHADTLILSTNNIIDTAYFRDAACTVPYPMPAQATQDKVYVKFTTNSNCELSAEILLNVVPRPTLSFSGGKTRDICSGTLATFTAVTTNVTSIQWSNFEKTGTAAISNANILSYTPKARTTDTIFYLRATVKGNSPCTEFRDSIKVTLRGKPTAVISDVSATSACAGHPVTFTLTTTNSRYFQWSGGAGIFSPTRLWADTPYEYYRENFSYTPAATERNTTVELNLKAAGGVCGYLTDKVVINVLPRPEMDLELVAQPRKPQTICTDTIFEVKVKTKGAGGLKNMVFSLFDENGTKITVNNPAEYKYPYNAGTWQSLGNYTLVGGNRYQYALPVELTGKDSVLVRIGVNPGCTFVSGKAVKFTLNATDLCNEPVLPAKTITGNKITLAGDPAVANLYTIKNTVTPATVNSQTNDTVVVNMNVVFEGTQATDNNHEIVTFIPDGLDVDPVSLVQLRNAGGAVSVVAASGGKEYHLTIPPGIMPKDSVMYQFKVSATGAPCGDYEIQHYVYYSYTATCGASTCTVNATRATGQSKISVKRYAFSLNSIQGETHLGAWSGDIRMNAINGMFASDSIKVDFYVDKDKNNFKSDADKFVITKYVKTSVNIGNNGILPVHFTGIAVEPAMQLIAYSDDPLLCSPMQFPITIMTGPDTVCRNDVTIFELAEGMSNYSVDAISGATRVPLTTVANYPKENKVQIRFIDASGNVRINGRYSRAIGSDTISSEKTAFRTYVNIPVSADKLKTKDNAVAYCSPGTAKIYAPNLKNASSVLWKAPAKAGTLTGQTTDTLTYHIGKRANDTTLWVSFHAQGAGGCGEIKDSIRLTIYASLQQGVPTGNTICYLGNHTFTLPDATGGNGNTYQWQDSTKHHNWQNVTAGVGANNSTYTTPALNDTTWYRRVVIAACGVRDTSAAVRIAVLPDFDAGEISSAGQIYCSGKDMPNTIGSLKGTSGGNYANGITYRWLLDGVEIANTNSATYTPVVSLPGVYTFTREAKDTKCNTDFEASSGSYLLTIHTPPEPTIIGPGSGCTGEHITFSTQAYGSYQWAITNGMDGTISGFGNTFTSIFTWYISGTKTISLTVSEINGCTATVTKDIVITPISDTGPIYRIPNRQ